MVEPFLLTPEPLRRMPDGTVKQINPYSGTSVWTVPRRGSRPLTLRSTKPQPLDLSRDGQYCAFCSGRQRETPPEKSRLVRTASGWMERTDVLADDLDTADFDFRRIPNLFEIVSYDYWHTNYAYLPSARAQARQAAYLATEAGRRHVLDLLRVKFTTEGTDPAAWDAIGEDERLTAAIGFFAGSHDVIVARRHYVDGATTDDQLASSGTLTPDEHARYLDVTTEALRGLYEDNRYARFVAVFQNWLAPAGASFDHLHKQLVAIDDRSIRMEQELARVRANLNFYNEHVVDYADRHNLVVAENDGAIAYAGFGHRYPSLVVFATGSTCRPWEQTEPERRAVSDLLHACHAATGSEVPCNEEWHYQPPDLDLPVPWRIVVKWRVSTLAGFEGGTKIYLNTIDPWTLRARVVDRLVQLRSDGAIAPNLRIATECHSRPNRLRYNPNLRPSDDARGPDPNSPVR